MTSLLPSLERLRLGPVPTGAPKQMGGEEVLDVDDTVYWYVYPNVPRRLVHPVQVRILSQRKELRPEGVYVMVYTVVVVDEDGDEIVDDDNQRKTIEKVRRNDLWRRHPADVEADAEPEPLPDAASDAASDAETESDGSEPYEIEGLPPPQRGVTLPRTLQDPLPPPPPPAQPPERNYVQGGKPRAIDPNDKGYHIKKYDRPLGEKQAPQGTPGDSDDEDGFGPYREDSEEEASTSRTDKNPEKRRRIQEFTPKQLQEMRDQVRQDSGFRNFNEWFEKYMVPLRNLEAKLYTRAEKLAAKKAAFKAIKMLVRFIDQNRAWLFGTFGPGSKGTGLLHSPPFATKWKRTIQDILSDFKKAAGVLKLKGILPGLEILQSKQVQTVLFTDRSKQRPDKNAQRKSMERAIDDLKNEVDALGQQVAAMQADDEYDDQQGQGMPNFTPLPAPDEQGGADFDEDHEDDLADYGEGNGDDGNADDPYS